MSEEFPGDDEVFEIPVDGVLDLHTFRPAEVRPLVQDYIEACLEKGILDLRIIHGKGTGTLRRIVHSVLEKDLRVETYGTASDSSTWGATVVRLRPDQ